MWSGRVPAPCLAHQLQWLRVSFKKAHPSPLLLFCGCRCRTPLWAGILSNIVHLGLDVVLVFWLGWGVMGAALATSLSHWVTTLVLGAMIISKGHLRCVGA